MYPQIGKVSFGTTSYVPIGGITTIGYVLIGRPDLPAMLENRWGRVVNVSGAIVAKSMNAATAAKAALESWSKASACLYADRGVTFNCMAPARPLTGWSSHRR